MTQKICEMFNKDVYAKKDYVFKSDFVPPKKSKVSKKQWIKNRIKKGKQNAAALKHIMKYKNYDIHKARAYLCKYPNYYEKKMKNKQKGGKKIRKHLGINQQTGKLKKGYKYSGKKLKSGLPQIIKL